MLFGTIRTVLAGAAPVTAICGQNIDSLVRPQAVALPSVTVQAIAVTPINGINGWYGLDGNLAQLDSWAATYTQAHELAAACRTAMQDAGHTMESEFDNYDPAAELAGVYRVTQEYSVWV